MGLKLALLNVEILCHLSISMTLILLCCSCGCSPLSESASTVGAGFAVPATQTGCMPMAEVFKLAVSSFKVNDWSLFGSAV